MDHLTGARAAVLSRLWGALAREPLPGLTGRTRAGGVLTVTLNGHVVDGPVEASEPFARPGVLTLRVDGLPIDDPAALIHAVRPPRDGVPTDDRAALIAAVRPPHDGVPTNDPAALIAAVRPPRDGVASGPTAGGRRAGHTSDAAGPRLDADVHDRFADELAGSVHGVALARAAAQPVPRTLIDLSGDPRSLAILEQSVVDGHPLHPLCRTRTGLGDDEIRAYAPEHHPRVDLEIYDVPADRWHTTGTGLPPRLLVHPWQRDHVLDRYPFLRRTGRTVPARPLMSLRTLALDREPGVHVKTAVDVQMTSAVRTVSAAAVHNGPVMSALLARLGLAVLTEEAAGAVLVDGEPERRLAMVRRRVPTLRPGEVALPFAVLSAPGPGGHPRVRELGDDPGATIAALARVTLPPLLRLLHQGIALEAHGQNLLLAVAGGRPTRVLYRDMGGVRVHPGRLRRAGIDPPELRGDIVTDDEDTLRTKLVAATVSTVFAELVATLRDTYGADPADLWRRVADAVRATYRDLPADAAGDEAAILGGSVPLKAMTAMRLSDTPLEDIWTPIANPMAR